MIEAYKTLTEMGSNRCYRCCDNRCVNPSQEGCRSESDHELPTVGMPPLLLVLALLTFRIVVLLDVLII
jgi:hypothetical protein